MKILRFKKTLGQLLAGVGLMVMLSSAMAVTVTTNAGGLGSNVLYQIAALQQEKASFSAVEQKMDSQLIFAFKQAMGLPIAGGAVPAMVIAAAADTNGMILVDIRGKVTSNLLAQVTQAGGRITNSFPQFNSIRASIPLDQVEAIAAAPDLIFIRPALKARRKADPEGVVVHRDDQARSTFPANGSNVKVGVMSDSVDYLTAAQGTGDCGPVTVLPGQSGEPNTGEGTAMLEEVYAMAPGAQLYFATGSGGEASFAQNILDLQAAGCNIIVDDIGYGDESPFQDGIVAQAVNTVTAGGTLYFSAAGNEGNFDSGTSGTWQGDFTNAGPVAAPVNGRGGSLHSFGGLNYDTITEGGEYTVLFWSDPAGKSTNDYDLYLLDPAGTKVVGSSVTVQNGTQDPYELIDAPSTNGELLVIVLSSGTNRFLYTSTYRGQFSNGTSGNITGHATATNAFAVAAVDCHDSYPNPFSGGAADPVEYFSSDGPRRVFYSATGTAITPGNFSSTGGYVRQKPDIAAADGISTTLPSDSGLNPFYGTSCAAPHAASIAALLLSYNPALTPAQVRSIMTGTALDIMAPGVDQDSGSGIVMALQALQGTPIPVPAPHFIYLTNLITGGNGDGLFDVNECDEFFITVTNVGDLGATGVQATLSTLTPGVTVAQPTVTFPNAPVGSAISNASGFEISLAPGFICGQPVNFTLVLKYDQGSATINFTVATSAGSLGTPQRYDNSSPVTITDSADGVGSFINVTNFDTALMYVQVSADIAESDDSNLALYLVGPDGTAVLLVDGEGGNGQNFGTDCSDGDRIFFDDSGASLSSSSAPFVGTFQPLEALSSFIGKYGSAVNGSWQLVAVDSVTGDHGAIECWSLFLTTAQCVDGGGQCPGVDLALGMTAPATVIVQNDFTFNISVTNFGPDTATGVALTQTLPTNVTVVSVRSSQGSSGESSGVVTSTLGTLAPGGIATVTVVVMPTATGTLFSTATVGSQQQDLNPANNTATTATTVTSPSADLSVTLKANPNPVLVNGLLTYVATVANVGPSPATNVVVTNTLPLNANFASSSSSQGGVLAPQANVVVANLGTLAVGSNATVTIQAYPLVSGSIIDIATVSSMEADPVSANNTASVTTTVTPAADLSLAISAPYSVVVGSNFTYQLYITNNGPNAATGVAVNDTLPAGVSYITAVASPQGVCTFAGSSVNCQITNIPAGSNATITITAGTTNLFGSAPVTVVDTAVVSATQADPNPTNNSASASTLVAYPKVSVVASGFLLAGESFVPTNGMIDPGETVTVFLKLQNQGNIATSGNVYATLLSSGGVAPAGNATQNYGTLAAGAPATGEFFQCTASGTNDGTATATLQLVTSGTNLGTASFTFNFPAAKNFASTNNIIIPDHGPGMPYPLSNLVSGITGLVGKVTVTLTNVNHTYPDDIDMLLVGPSGQNVLLMSHAGYNGVLTNVSLTFDDRATNANGTTKYLPASTNLSGSTQIVSGTYSPSQYGTVSFASNAPPQPYGTNLAVFNGTSPNGYWQLFVFDSSPGDDGIILGGYSLAITSGSEVDPVADLGVAGFVSPNPVQLGNNLFYTFTVTNNGPSASTTSTFTDALPASLAFVSATNSAHTPFTLGNNGVLSCSFTNLAVGTVVTVTVVATPTVSGAITNQATITGADSDPNQVNNSTILTDTVNAPFADLAVSISGTTNAGLMAPSTNSPPTASITYFISVTNRGPGVGLNVYLTNMFDGPAVNNPGSNVTNTAYSLGTLASGMFTNVMISLAPTQPGAFTNVATVYTASSDTNFSNNSASIVTVVTAPAPLIVTAGTPQFFNPVPNSSLPVGQPVTVSLGLANVGTAATSNLVATLLNTNGVTGSSGAVGYGALQVNGPAGFGNFMFTATGVNGGSVMLVLQLQDGTNNLGSVAYTFGLPGTNSFAGGGIVIPDHGPGLPYPSAINITNVNGFISKATVTLTNLTHEFANDVEVMLVSPSGQGLVLMSGVGGNNPITNATLTFDDAATNNLPPSGTGAPVISGTYLPVNDGMLLPFASPAPAAPYLTNLAGFNGVNPNGTWALYVYDNSPGDDGNIPSWSLNLATVSPINGVANLGLSLVAPAIAYPGIPFTVTFTVTNKGPATATNLDIYTPNLGGLDFVSSSIGPAYPSGGGLNVYPGNVPADTETNFTVTLVAPTNGQFSSTLAVTSVETDLNPSDNSVQLSVNVHPTPKLAAALVRGGGTTNLVLTLTADAGHYTIQATTNLTPGLINWVTVGTVTNISGNITLTDSNILSHPSRYYRAVLAP